MFGSPKLVSVGKVECLGAELKVGFFSDRKVLGQARIELPEAETADSVAGRIAKGRIGLRGGEGCLR